MTELKRLTSSGTRPGTTGRECRLLYNKCDVKRHHKLLNNSKTRLFLLYSQNYAARSLPILFNTPQKIPTQTRYPKKYLPNFRTQKNPGIKNFKPKKILRSSTSLEIQSTRGSRGIILSQANIYHDILFSCFLLVKYLRGF